MRLRRLRGLIGQRASLDPSQSDALVVGTSKRGNGAAIWRACKAPRRLGFAFGMIVGTLMMSGGGWLMGAASPGWTSIPGAMEPPAGDPRYRTFRYVSPFGEQLLALHQRGYLGVSVWTFASGWCELIEESEVAEHSIWETLQQHGGVLPGDWSASNPPPSIIMVSSFGWPFRAATQTITIDRPAVTPIVTDDTVRNIPAWIANVLAVSILASALFMVPRLIRCLMRTLLGRCSVCGYPVSSSGSMPCPECGSACEWSHRGK